MSHSRWFCKIKKTLSNNSSKNCRNIKQNGVSKKNLGACVHGSRHFPHTRSPLGTFIADHQYLSRLDLPFQDGLVCFLLSVEISGFTCEGVHVRINGCGLGQQIACQI